MRVPKGCMRTAIQAKSADEKRMAELDARYVCMWVVQADQLKTHQLPQNIVDLAKRAIE